MSATNPGRRPAPWTILAAALAGLLVGVLVAVLVTSSPPRYRAAATLALLPGPQLAAQELPDYWEVLSRGQATRTSALVLGQPRWLAAAALESGEPVDRLTLAAGAIPDTSLISVTMEADTSRAAELALRSVIQGGSGEAAAVSGPFALNVVSDPEGSAVSLAPNELPVLVAGGLAGLLIGAGAGLVVGRAVAGRRARRPGAAADGRAAPAAEPRVAEPRVSEPRVAEPPVSAAAGHAPAANDPVTEVALPAVGARAGAGHPGGPAGRRVERPGAGIGEPGSGPVRAGHPVPSHPGLLSSAAATGAATGTAAGLPRPRPGDSTGRRPDRPEPGERRR